MTGTKSKVQTDVADGESVTINFDMSGVENIDVLISDDNGGTPPDYTFTYSVEDVDGRSYIVDNGELATSDTSKSFKPIGEKGEVTVSNASGGTATHRVTVIYE